MLLSFKCSVPEQGRASVLSGELAHVFVSLSLCVGDSLIPLATTHHSPLTCDVTAHVKIYLVRAASFET